MEITESMVYWVTRLDGVKITMGCLIGAFAVITTLCFLWVIHAIDYNNNKKLPIIFSIVSFLLIIVFSIGVVLTPSTKQMCAIKVLPVIANNDKVQQLPDKIVNLADEWIDELSPKKTTTDN